MSDYKNNIPIFDEKVDVKALKFIIDNFDAIYPKLREDSRCKLANFSKQKKSQEQQLSILKSLYINKSNGKTLVKYTYSTESKTEGRLFQKDPSLQGIHHKIRHTISKDIYHDIDMINCHPKILSHICKLHNISCVYLDNYISNRDSLLKDLSDNYSLTRDSAKSIILSLLNGGPLSDKDFPNLIYPKWLKDFYNEMKNTLSNICRIEEKLYTKVQKYCKKTFKGVPINPEGKTVNRILCRIENEILMTAVNFFQQNDISIGTLVFDGLMIYKHSSLTQEKLNHLLEELSKFIFEEHKIDIKFSIKPMDKFLQLDSFISPIVRNTFLSDEEYNTLFTDEGLGIFILSKLQHNIYYNKNTKYLYYFNSTSCLYELIEPQKLTTYFSTILDPIFDQRMNSNSFDEKETKKIELLKKYYKSSNGQRSILHQITNRFKDQSKFIDEHFDKKPHLFPIKDNKVFDFKSNTVIDRLPSHYFTRTTDNTYIENPNSNLIKNYVAKLLNLLDKDIDDKTDDIKYTPEEEEYISDFLTISSYTLTNYNNMKLFPIFTGSGSNGKSLYLDLLKQIVDSFCVTANKKVFLQSKVETVHETHMFSISNGIRLAVISEAPDDSKFNTEIIKGITGDDKYFRSRKCGSPDEIPLNISCKLIGVFNEVPNFYDQALNNRLAVFVFGQKFPNDSKKKNEILGYKDHLFSVLTQYAHNLVSNPIDFKIGKRIQQNNKDLVSSKDSVLSYINDDFEITVDEKNKLSANDIYSDYPQFCRENGFTLLGKREFLKNLRSKFPDLKEVKIKGYSYFKYIKRLGCNEDTNFI